MSVTSLLRRVVPPSSTSDHDNAPVVLCNYDSADVNAAMSQSDDYEIPGIGAASEARRYPNTNDDAPLTGG